MADIILDGKVKVAIVPAVASLAAPTVAEIAAGELVSPVMPADGMQGFEPTTNRVDTTSIESTFDTFAYGRTGFGDVALVLKKQSGTDDVFNLLNDYGADLYMIVRIGVDATTAFAASDAVRVYPIKLGQWSDVSFEPNSVQRYKVPVGIYATPDYDAVVAA